MAIGLNGLGKRHSGPDFESDPELSPGRVLDNKSTLFFSHSPGDFEVTR